MTGNTVYPKSSFIFPDLPDLVLDCIIQHLEPNDILSLRLVCKATNSWITQNPKLLKNFKLQISTKKSLHEISKSSVLWNNFNFCVPPGQLKQTSVIRIFFQNFGPYMQILDLYPVVNPNEAWDITSCNVRLPKPLVLYYYDDYFLSIEAFQMIMEFCSSLHSLRIGKLRLKQNEDITNCINILKTKNLQSLKVFEIQELICSEEEQYRCFEDILFCFPSLEILHLPWIPNVPHNRAQHIFAKYILKSVTTYIVCQISRGNCTLKAVNFWKHEIPSVGHKDVLVELARSCCTSKTVIIIPLTFLWDITLIELLSEVQVLQTLENIEIQLGKPLPPLGEMELANLKRIYIHCTYIPQTFRNNINKSLLESYKNRNMRFRMPNLQEVYLDDGDSIFYLQNKADETVKEFLNFMTSVSFPSVRVLCFPIKWGERLDNESVPTLRVWNICNGFPNLVKLKLTCWTENTEGFLILFNSLKLLEEVSLHYCPHFGDYAIIGNGYDGEDAPLLQLKYLKRMHINRCGEITDKSYRLVFRHLKLEYFYHNEHIHSDYNIFATRFHHPARQVTKKCLEFLTHGEFCKAIQTMNIYDFDFKWDEGSKEFNVFLGKFPNLKSTLSRTNPMHFGTTGNRSVFVLSKTEKCVIICCCIMLIYMLIGLILNTIREN